MKDRKLFGTQIAQDENPSYVAVLIHELFTQSLQYFELSNTKFAKELNEAILITLFGSRLLAS
jgi:hypothetical protein